MMFLSYTVQRYRRNYSNISLLLRALIREMSTRIHRHQPETAMNAAQFYHWDRQSSFGTWWHTVTQGGEVKGKLANGVGSQYSHATSERGLSSITQAEAHTSAASSRLN